MEIAPAQWERNMEQPASPNAIFRAPPMLAISFLCGGIAFAIGRRKVSNAALWTIL